MITKEGPFARILFRYFPLGIAIISALFSGATFFNTIYQQDRELGRKELMIEPYLSFFLDSGIPQERVYEIALGLRNDGLGPAVIEEIILGVDGECISSSNYSTFSEWDSFYQTKVGSQFTNLLTKDINALVALEAQKVDVYDKLNASSEGPVKPLPKESKKQKGYTDYEVYEQSGVAVLETTFRMPTLSPGTVVSIGSSYEIVRVDGKLTPHVTKVERKKITEGVLAITANPALEPDSHPFPQSSIYAVGIGVWYCSFSGMYCNFVSQGDPKCFAKTDVPLERIDQSEPRDNWAAFL